MMPSVRAWIPRLNSRRYRRVFIACLATLGISASVLALLIFVRWRTEHAVRGDTRVVFNQSAQQLLRALQSRRGTLTLLRDTLDHAPDLQRAERQTLAMSAVSHTRHLVGVGVLRAGAPITWWHLLSSTAHRERTSLDRALQQSATHRTVWRVPSTFPVIVHPDRPLLVMLEPLRSPANRASAVIGVFDLTPLLTDFFELTLQQPYPVQLLDGSHVLYRSPRWAVSSADHRDLVLERPLTLDSLSWTLQMQPGTTQVARTMSWFNTLLSGLGLLAALGAIGIIWLLAMRTWILQRAVARRTAALRRTSERLRQLAITDELTGLYNRRFFLERWQWEFQRAKRYRRPLGCLMIDVDKFKRINDILGHPAGDQLLKQVAQELRVHLRHSDILARFGGDEFIVALPETSPAQAETVAGKLRELSIHGPWTNHPQVGPVRLSVGFSQLDAEESPQQLIQHADADLYASRQAAQQDASHAAAS